MYASVWRYLYVYTHRWAAVPTPWKGQLSLGLSSIDSLIKQA